MARPPSWSAAARGHRAAGAAPRRGNQHGRPPGPRNRSTCPRAVTTAWSSATPTAPPRGTWRSITPSPMRPRRCWSSTTPRRCTPAARSGSTPYYPWARDRARRDDPRRDRACRALGDSPARSPGRQALPAGSAARPGVDPGPASPVGDDLAGRAAERLAGDLAMISTDLGWTVLLVTAAAAYLHRVSGADRFSIGLPVHNRTDAATRQIVGPVMEVFPVDVAVEPDDTYRDLHRRVGRAVMSTLRHAAVGHRAQQRRRRGGRQRDPPRRAGRLRRHPGGDPVGAPGCRRTQATSSGCSSPPTAAALELALDLNHAAAGAATSPGRPATSNAVLDDLVHRPRPAARCPVAVRAGRT